jgi:hypothetical protein
MKECFLHKFAFSRQHQNANSEQKKLKNDRNIKYYDAENFIGNNS